MSPMIPTEAWAVVTDRGVCGYVGLEKGRKWADYLASQSSKNSRVVRVQITEDWRPFSELVPKDGAEYIVFRPDALVFTAIYCPAHGEEDSDECHWFASCNGEDIGNDLPTHYMPLPAPPQSAEGPNK